MLVVARALRRRAALRRRHDHAGDLRARAVEGLAGRDAGARAAWSCRSRWRSSSALFAAAAARHRRPSATLFGPVMVVWFVVDRARSASSRSSSAPGDPARRSSPTYAVALLRGATRGCGFLVLGAVVLAITGGEALYADMGHFGARPIRMRLVRASSSRRCSSTTSGRAPCSCDSAGGRRQPVLPAGAGLGAVCRWSCSRRWRRSSPRRPSSRAPSRSPSRRCSSATFRAWRSCTPRSTRHGADLRARGQLVSAGRA